VKRYERSARLLLKPSICASQISDPVQFSFTFSRAPKPVKLKRRKLREFAAIYLAVARPIVPRTPSLELYVLPIGGGQLINFPKSKWS
jgi:hypothetical protein